MSGNRFAAQTSGLEHGYEEVDLGDEKRNNKFLKLMGSKKRDECKPVAKSEGCELKEHTAQSAVEEPEVVNVCSANEWEAANMGDVNRKNKFLRLMGATKKEHSGKFVIGDKEKEDTKPGATPKGTNGGDLEDLLEKQYNQGLLLRVTGAARRHTGFGFEEPPLKEESKLVDSAEHTRDNTEQNPEDKDSKDNAQSDRDRQYREERRGDHNSRRGYEDRGDRRGHGQSDRERRGDHRAIDTYSQDRRDYTTRDNRQDGYRRDRREEEKERDGHKEGNQRDRVYSQQSRDYPRDRSSGSVNRDRQDSRSRYGDEGNARSQDNYRDNHQRSESREGYRPQTHGTHQPGTNPQQEQQVVGRSSQASGTSGYSGAPVAGEYGTPAASKQAMALSTGGGAYSQGQPQAAALPVGGGYPGYQYTTPPPPPPPPAQQAGSGQWYGTTQQNLFTTIAAPPPPPQPSSVPTAPSYPVNVQTGYQAAPSHQPSQHAHHQTPAGGYQPQQSVQHSTTMSAPQPNTRHTTAPAALFKSKISFVKSSD